MDSDVVVLNIITAAAATTAVDSDVTLSGSSSFCASAVAETDSAANGCLQLIVIPKQGCRPEFFRPAPLYSFYTILVIFSMSFMIEDAFCTSFLPAKVRLMPMGVLSKIVIPSSVSSFFTVLLTLNWDRYRFSAALDTEPVPAISDTY